MRTPLTLGSSARQGLHYSPRSRLERAPCLGAQHAQPYGPVPVHVPESPTGQRFSDPSEEVQPHPSPCPAGGRDAELEAEQLLLPPKEGSPAALGEARGRAAGEWGGEREAQARARPSLTPRVPAVVRPAPPRGTGPRGRPGGAEEPAEPGAVPRRPPDPGAAGGRRAGRGGLREYLPVRPLHPPRWPCALRPTARPQDSRSGRLSPKPSRHDSRPLSVPRSGVWSASGRVAGGVGGRLSPPPLSFTSCPPSSSSWCGQAPGGSLSGHPEGDPKRGEL